MSRLENNRKIKKKITEIERRNHLNDEKNKCDCLHFRKKGELSLIPTNKGKLIYLCGECRKELDLNVFNDAEIDHALNVIDRMCDAIKLNIDPDVEKDEKIANCVAEVQFRVRTQMRDWYVNALRSKNDRKRPKRDTTSSWGAAEIR